MTGLNDSQDNGDIGRQNGENEWSFTNTSSDDPGHHNCPICGSTLTKRSEPDAPTASDLDNIQSQLAAARSATDGD